MPSPPAERRYPGPVLRTASDYAWRLIILAAVVYLLVRGLSSLTTVVIPFIASLLLTALLHPLQTLLRRLRVPRALSTALTVIIAVLVIAGILALVVDKGINQAPQLGDQVNRLIPKVEHWLETGPFKLSKSEIGGLSSKLSGEVSKNSSAVASAALSTGKAVVDALTGLVLGIFTVIFMLYDGEGIWQFLCRAVPKAGRERADRGGRAAWQTLSHYMRGTLVVAAFHGIVISIVLLVLGVPLVAPLALLVALASFVPLVGAVVAGVVVAGVAGVEQGIGAAIVIVIVLVIDNQVEAHVLQPFVVGRYIHVHPLAVVLALATGAVLFSIFGAIIAVPTMACINSGVRAAIAVPEPEEAMEPEQVPPEPDGEPNPAN